MTEKEHLELEFLPGDEAEHQWFDADHVPHHDEAIRSYRWLTKTPAHVRFRRVAVELFGELQELITADESVESKLDMVVSCDWVMLRIEDLKQNLLVELPPNKREFQFRIMSATDADDRFDIPPDEQPIGRIKIPAWSIARLAKQGLSTSEIIDQWKGELTKEDIEKALKLASHSEHLQDDE